MLFRSNCMTSEIQKYPAADELTSDIASSLPSTELYRKNYASPIFVFSLSGVMILITIIVALAIICRMFWWIILRLALFFV